MLRALVVLLLAANLLFLAWSRGWLSPWLPLPHAGEREPERLLAQLRPETVRIVPPALAASLARAAAAPACVESGPFADADVAAAEAALTTAGVPAGAWMRRTQQGDPEWLVVMGRYADAALLRTKQDELRRLRVTFDVVTAPPEIAPGLVLARGADKAAADAALGQLAQRGVHTARVVALPAPPPQTWLRVADADAGLRQRLGAIAAPLPPFAACAG